MFVELRKVVTLLKKNTLMMIRKDIENCIGKRVILRADKGRRRIVTREGVIEAAYPNLFVVKVDNDFGSKRKVSHTYTDVFTGTVEVTIRSDSQQEKIS